MATSRSMMNRRSFLKSTALAGGGLMISFGWLQSLASSEAGPLKTLSDGTQLNGYLKISADGIITIMSPNPEGGQNVKTTMPMIIAEELDVDWEKVIVEQAPLDTSKFTRQFIGGSQALRHSWKTLRTAGATARRMLLEAAAQSWKVPVIELATEHGTIYHKASGKKTTYGTMATAAASLPIPNDVELKDFRNFKLIGSSKKNVDSKKIYTGKPLFGIDIRREGMLIAMIVHPPAFGMKFKAISNGEAKAMPGIVDIFPIKVYNEDYERQFFDTCTFNEVVAIVGKTTWQVMKAKKVLQLEWEPITEYTINRNAFEKKEVVTIPAGLESSTKHRDTLNYLLARPANVVRKDGNPEEAFARAAKVIERTYTAPFLAHNCMEPMNFFAYVTDEKAELAGPLQKAELTEKTLSTRLGLPLDKINIEMTRLGGGFGRRSYAHWLIEAALISQKVNAPVKLLYTREDDMTSGIYRPAYAARYRAALDAKNQLIAFHVKAGGIPESPLEANRFPAGAVDNYLAEEFVVKSNITTGSFRAPRSNFTAAAEQSFLDEVAEAIGKDPIAFRLELLERANTNPVGEKNDYDASRYAGVLRLVREKSDWSNPSKNTHRGVAAYFCHNSYVAQVVDLTIRDGKPVVERVCSAVDCGIVVNPDAAKNLVEGSVVDAVGNALFGELTFKNGVPEKSNFNSYRMIRYSEAPRVIDVHFVKNDIDPTGLGEPAFPPVFAALANALYKATGQRLYDQPFMPRLTEHLGQS